MKSTVEEGNSYTTLTSYTKDFMIVPTISGWDYIPRTKHDKRTKDCSSQGTHQRIKIIN